MVTQGDIDALFKAVADPTRRAILEALLREPLAVQAIAERFPKMSRPAISKHLRILREAGLVEEEQQGRQRYYHLLQGSLTALGSWLGSFPDAGGTAAAGVRAAREASPGRARTGRTAVPEKSAAWRFW